MERILVFFRTQPYLAAAAMVAVIAVLVLSFLSIAMSKSGMSLRPILWFIGFFAIIGVPQVSLKLLDLYLSRRSVPDSSVSRPAPASPGPAASLGNLQPTPWQNVFGLDADPQLITDATRSLPMIFGTALEAKISFNRNGDTAAAGRFANPVAAQEALNTYGKFFAFAHVTGSDATGWTARRHAGQGDWAHVITAGAELYVWTSVNRSTVVANRERTLGPLPMNMASPPQGSKSAGETQQKGVIERNTSFMVSFLVANVLLAGAWFFKGSAWAARVEAPQTALPASADSLRRVLLAINDVDTPTTVTALGDGSIEVTWRYADARWFDLMRVHQMKRIHKLLLIPDEQEHTVRVREYWSSFDASASPSTFRASWTMNTGMQFFVVEKQTVFGAQLGADGKPTGKLSHTYSFDLQQLKAPVIDAVVRAGWRWQPVMWNAPASLRWLTE